MCEKAKKKKQPGLKIPPPPIGERTLLPPLPWVLISQNSFSHKPPLSGASCPQGKSSPPWGCPSTHTHSTTGSILSAGTLCGSVFLPSWLWPAPSEAHYFFKQILPGIDLHIPGAQYCTWDPKVLDEYLGNSRETDGDTYTKEVWHSSGCSEWKDAGKLGDSKWKSQSLHPSVN